jgi:hypothetical protein
MPIMNIEFDFVEMCHKSFHQVMDNLHLKIKWVKRIFLGPLLNLHHVTMNDPSIYKGFVQSKNIVTSCGC